MMTILQVFDPPMCCSTGVCGPSVPPELARFAADLEWIRTQGCAVVRHNLAQEPRAFVENAAVKQALEERGEACLPIVLRDGTLLSAGVYPTRDELAAWVGLGTSGCCGGGVPETQATTTPPSASTGCCDGPTPDATSGGCC